jgi:hypothetical protein
MKTSVETNLSDRAGAMAARFSAFRNVSRFLLVALVLFGASDCSVWKSFQPEPLPSEMADAEINAPYAPVRLMLNMKDVGTTADLRRLRTVIRDIVGQREANGVFMQGSNEIENTVYVSVDEHVSVGVLAELISAINQNGGKAYLPVNPDRLQSPDSRSRPNPLNLIVSAGERKPSLFALYAVDGSEAPKYAVSPSVEIVSDWKEIKLARSIGSSLEISANGGYFFNGPTIFLSTMEIEEVEVVQRPVVESFLRQEVTTLGSWAARSDGIKVVASEFAPASSLWRVLEAVDATEYRWNLVVRDTPRNQDRKQ